MICDWCKTEKLKMTIMWNLISGKILTLCFRGCQHFPEPYRAESKDTEEYQAWVRIDPWVKKRNQPKLRRKDLYETGLFHKKREN